MRTLEEYSVVLPPVACADIATMAGQALIYCPEDESEIMVRDYLFTPFGLTATVRFDPDGSIADKKLSAGSWHDLLNAAIETIAMRNGIDHDAPEDWALMEQIFHDWQAVLDAPAIVDDLASARIFVIPGLEDKPDVLGGILDGTITMDVARANAVNVVDFENDKSLRRNGVVIDDTWSQDEAEIEAAIADAALEDEVVLFGVLDDPNLFMHTIGLSENAWPEIVVRNLDPHLSPYLLRTIVALHEMAGVAPSPGRIPDDVMPGGLRLRELDRHLVHETFPRADGGTGVLEVVFPL